MGVAAAVRWSWLVAKPDQWLLRIRDGRLVRAGIGISVWRRPGDAIVRFTSAVQRVATLPTATLLSDRAGLAERVGERLSTLAESLGFRIVQVEVQGVAPADPVLAKELSAREDRGIREEAERVRLESAERMKRAA